MAGKMSGSPFHVETRQYKYATEQSEVPIAKSEFNQTITRCSRCAYNCILKDSFVCTNTSVHKYGDHHCMGYLDSKSVPDLTLFKNRLLTKYLCFQNHELIDSVVKMLNNYTCGSSKLIDSYYGKKWAVLGSNIEYDKNDLVRLIQALHGEYWSSKCSWNVENTDYAVNMGSKNEKLKELRKRINQGLYQEETPPRIILIEQLRKDIIRMKAALTMMQHVNR